MVNHTSVQHPWFIDARKGKDFEYRDWYIWSDSKPNYLGPWGEQVWHKNSVDGSYYYGVFWDGMPDLNFRNPAVTAEIEKVAKLLVRRSRGRWISVWMVPAI